MYEKREKNTCPLRFQTGAQGVQNFDAILQKLAPEQRSAFETERMKRQSELKAYVTSFGYHT